MVNMAMASASGSPVLLRHAYRGRVPDSILDGAKMGLRYHSTWFRGDLQGYAREVLLILDPWPRLPRKLHPVHSRRSAAVAVTARASFGPS